MKMMTSNNYSLAKVREKFTDWWWSVIKCSAIYGGIYLLAKGIINFFLVKHMEYLTTEFTRWTVAATALILGVLYLWDAKISGFLKTPLARLANKVENCSFLKNEAKNEQEKVFFLSATQEANELFKKTFEKFGLLAIPVLLLNLLDNGKLTTIRKLSGHPLILLSYALPISWASWKTLLIHWHLTELEQAESSGAEHYNPHLENYE